MKDTTFSLEFIEQKPDAVLSVIEVYYDENKKLPNWLEEYYYKKSLETLDYYCKKEPELRESVFHTFICKLEQALSSRYDEKVCFVYGDDLDIEFGILDLYSILNEDYVLKNLRQTCSDDVDKLIKKVNYNAKKDFYIELLSSFGPDIEVTFDSSNSLLDVCIKYKEAYKIIYKYYNKQETLL